MVRFLTTHQIAGMIGVSERTVANWIDRGHLEAFRTPGGHRRVAPACLKTFLTARGIPIHESLDGETRILIVEDDPEVAKILKGYLSGDTGYDVTTIGDGVNALIHIGNRKPKLVILDILIPGLNGLEVCRKIRENPELRDVQVMFVTGRPDADPESIKRESGASEVLVKPIRGAELRSAVERVLSLGKPAPAH